MLGKSANLDHVFKSLSDSTRRDILRRLVQHELSISEIADPYDLTYAAVSKHIKVLEDANLVKRRREGKRFMLKTNSSPFILIDDWMEYYRNHWSEVFDQLDNYLVELQQENEPNEK